MKRTITLLALLLILIEVQAKQKFGIDLGIGVKGGINFNKILGKGWIEQFNTDPHFGFFAHLNKRRVGIQIEALWSQNHMTTDSSFRGLYKQYLNNVGDSLNNGMFRFNTISLPILINIKLSQWLWIQAGPQFNANINVVDKNQILRSGVSIINQQSYSAVGGIWIQFGGKAPLIRVNAGARFVAALNNINMLETNEVWKNQMVQLHLGLSY